MQFQQIKPSAKVFFSVLVSALLLQMDVSAQVNTVEFGKNRVQFRKFKWQYYQTTNFNTYFYENGKTIANYVTQIAEKELPLPSGLMVSVPWGAGIERTLCLPLTMFTPFRATGGNVFTTTS